MSDNAATVLCIGIMFGALVLIFLIMAWFTYRD